MKLTTRSNPKILKGEKYGYRTIGLFLAPSNLSGHNVCPKASAGCIATCLNTAGRGQMNNVQRARLARTALFFADRDAFMFQLSTELVTEIKSAKRAGLIPVVRLNGTSDIRWEDIPVPCSTGPQDYLANYYPNIMAMFPEVQFYDYTKLLDRMEGGPADPMPTNYHLTASRDETNDANCLSVLKSGGNVAVVFSTKKGQPLPKTWNGYTVIDGDEHDLRFRDVRGVVVGLRAKGKARKDTSGFVVRV